MGTTVCSQRPPSCVRPSERISSSDVPNTPPAEMTPHRAQMASPFVVTTAIARPDSSKAIRSARVSCHTATGWSLLGSSPDPPPMLPGPSSGSSKSVYIVVLRMFSVAPRKASAPPTAPWTLAMEQPGLVHA
eukprot:scaffold49026_cov29-Tisochrysis_lutea.AAC.3